VQEYYYDDKLNYIESSNYFSGIFYFVYFCMFCMH